MSTCNRATRTLGFIARPTKGINNPTPRVGYCAESPVRDLGLIFNIRLYFDDHVLVQQGHSTPLEDFKRSHSLS
ncbi:hypothetical protein J6590_077611 [Homalodisca vitripennis]|nr:hypothetical protein J6590_077611 [Homalodisca vitripennis]